jgi:hypothetical protein
LLIAKGGSIREFFYFGSNLPKKVPNHYSQGSISEQAELDEQALIKQSKIKVIQWKNLGIFPQNS